MRTGVPETVPPYREAQTACCEASWSTRDPAAHEKPSPLPGLIGAGDRTAERAMEDRQRTMMKRLLDRLLATRARRDREERDSPPWRAADTELHEIERAIFRVPLEEPLPIAGGDGRTRPAPTGMRRRLRRAAAMARTRGIQEQGAG